MSEGPGAAMSARRLVAWADVEDSRRRRRQRAPFNLPGWAATAALGLAVAAEVWRRAASDPAAASSLWSLAVAAAATLAAMGAPFRLYWRHDAAIIARLPIAGDTLFRAALWRSARAGGRVMLVALPGLIPLAVAGDLASAGRHGALALGGAAAAVTLAPAAALGAGALVASERAQAAVASMAGEVRAPPTAWLGMLPGVAAAAIALALLFAGTWARQGGAQPALGLLFGLVAAGALAAAWGLRAAARAMPAAVREISALDRDRLAHVEIVGPSRLERLWGRALARGEGARAVYDKDAALLRRRYPMVYAASAAGIGALWIVAVSRPDEYLAWTAGIMAFLGAYAIVVSRRLWSPPIEHARYLCSLAVEPAAARSAKRAAATLRVAAVAVLGGVPAIARAHQPLETAAAVAAVSLGAIAIAAAARS